MPTFTEILTAVAPRDRTDSYKVLTALYCLQATHPAVTVKEIRDLCKLHLNKRTPDNISQLLRRMPALVEVADRGPPLTWKLTAKGVSELRATSKLDLSTQASTNSYQTDVGVVCALETPEFSAVMDAMNGAPAWIELANPGIPHRYRETSLLTAAGRRLRVIGTASMSMGLTSAAIATTQLILLHRPRLVMMVGIAAGTRSGGKQFGDVLVADPSVDYNSGKVVETDGIREFQPDPYPIGINPRLRSLLQKYVANPGVFSAIRAGWNAKTPERPNRLHLGPLGASDQVIDDAARVIEIQKNWRKLIGVEMETYAVYRSCHDAPDPKPRFVSFKAVCDFAAAKTDSWQEYAAFVAAQFSAAFLKQEWEALWPDLGAGS